MYPTLFQLGPLAIRSYGLMMMIGFLVAIHFAGKRARKSGGDEEFVVNLGLLALLSGIAGSRIFYILHHLPQFLGSSNPILAMIDLTSGGLEFYGGFLTAVAGIIIYLRVKKRSMRWYLDILAPAIMIGLGFGRIGCFLNGCCWGAPTKSPIAVQFPYGSLAMEYQWMKTHEVKIPGELIIQTPTGSPLLINREMIDITDEEIAEKLASAKTAAGEAYLMKLLQNHLDKYQTNMDGLREIVKKLNLKSLPVHPSQLYSSLNAFLIAGILGVYYWRRKRDGMVIAWLFVIYPISRFILEGIRADNPIDTFGQFTISQGISLLAAPAAIVAMIILRFLPARSSYAIAELESKAKSKEIKTARPASE